MRAVIQRVTRAAVTVEGRVTGRIGHGLLVFAGVANGVRLCLLRLLRLRLLRMRLRSRGLCWLLRAGGLGGERAGQRSVSTQASGPSTVRLTVPWRSVR